MGFGEGERMEKGTVICNRETGETITVLVSEDETHGALQLYRVRLPPHRAGPPLHYHVALRETFTVIEGTLNTYIPITSRHRLKIACPTPGGSCVPSRMASSAERICRRPFNPSFLPLIAISLGAFALMITLLALCDRSRMTGKRSLFL